MKTTPFWTDQYPRPADMPASQLPAEVDVLVIGGGYTGLNVARVLAKAGARVVVLEQHAIGWGASSRNNGMATTGSKQSVQDVFTHYGEEVGRDYWQAALNAIDLIGEIAADEELAINFRRKGHIILAAKPTHFSKLQEQEVWFRQTLDHRMQLLGPQELQNEVGTKTYYGGLVDEWSASLNPVQFAYGLAQVVAKYGGAICEDAPVTRIEHLPQGFRVYTDKGEVRAREIVLATNGYTGGLIPRLQNRMFAVGSYAVVTEPLTPDVQQAICPSGRVFYDSQRFLHYFRLTPDGRFLFGGRNEWALDENLVLTAKAFRREMVRIFPQLTGVEITHSWNGRLGISFDFIPHIGRMSGVHYALGYSGHGVALATYLGTELGLLLTGQKQRSVFVDVPHPTRFYHRKTPWFLPALRRYYRLRDWLGR